MSRRQAAAGVCFLLLIAFAFASGWYVSGRDYRTLRDGLSVRFRDRGKVVFDVVKKAAGPQERDDEDSARELLFGDASRALGEAARCVKTKNDAKLYAILSSYYLSYDVPFEQMQLLKKMEANLAAQVDLTKELVASGTEADRNLARSSLAETRKTTAMVSETNKQVVAELPGLANNGGNCEAAAAQYFGDPPAAVPSEGLDMLCRSVPKENSVVVKGPDGKIYRFPAGTTSEKVAEYFTRKGTSAKEHLPNGR